jgi:hypothetical protein
MLHAEKSPEARSLDLILDHLLRKTCVNRLSISGIQSSRELECASVDMSASSISPRGDRSCSSETGHSTEKICDSLCWVENTRRHEGQSTYRSFLPKDTRQ